MPKFPARRLCRIALLAALSFLLTMLRLDLPMNLRITFASLPVTVAAMLFGPVDAMLAALAGEFLTQLLSYGVTATTALWLLPPALRALPIGFAALRCAQQGRTLESRPALCYGVCAAAAVLTTAANTAVICLDSVIYHYYSFAYVFGSALARFLTGVLTAAAVATVSMPLTALLRRRLPGIRP